MSDLAIQSGSATYPQTFSTQGATLWSTDHASQAALADVMAILSKMSPDASSGTGDAGSADAPAGPAGQ